MILVSNERKQRTTKIGISIILFHIKYVLAFQVTTKILKWNLIRDELHQVV